MPFPSPTSPTTPPSPPPLNQPHSRSGAFCAAFADLRAASLLVREERTFVATQVTGNAAKCTLSDEEKAATLKNYILRIAYFVRLYQIPRELVMNADHTGIRYSQQKDGTWTTKLPRANAKEVKRHNRDDKRQITYLGAITAAGKVVPGQIIVKGATIKALPAVGTYKKAQADEAVREKKGKLSGVGAVLETIHEDSTFHSDVKKWIGHFCATTNHWANEITSMDFVQYIVAPFFREEMRLLREKGVCVPASQACTHPLRTTLYVRVRRRSARSLTPQLCCADVPADPRCVVRLVDRKVQRLHGGEVPLDQGKSPV